ncbi:hypothetical protein HED50_12875 [Ochrobactrum oryzae]|uniref:Uncharacterized protein n=1 Tax=Brucella oryzae TaxID=335286 RepID=A0A2S7IVE3_9HYPH|nr:hypothetical protein [Brucella oryzae]PQA71972.1 hypothetical protein C3731_19085 [Brucella oryzae]
MIPAAASDLKPSSLSEPVLYIARHDSHAVDLNANSPWSGTYRIALFSGAIADRQNAEPATTHPPETAWPETIHTAEFSFPFVNACIIGMPNLYSFRMPMFCSFVK